MKWYKLLLISLIASAGLSGVPAVAQNDTPQNTNTDYPCAHHEEPWIEVIRPERKLNFWCGYRLHKTFRVGLGKPGWETQPGYYEVKWMREDPVFLNPFTGERVTGPQNPIAPLFIAVYYDARPGRNFWVGLHGTPDEDSVGQFSSHGCLRMRRKDVLLLGRWVTARMFVLIHDEGYIPPRE